MSQIVRIRSLLAAENAELSTQEPVLHKQKSILIVVPDDVDKFLNEKFNVDPNQSMNSDEEMLPTSVSHP